MLRAALALVALSCQSAALCAAELLVQPIAEYQLGGAAEFDETKSSFATVPDEQIPSTFLYFPGRTPGHLLSDQPDRTSAGDVVVFGGETVEFGRDVLRLGTALARGRTTTGVYVTYAGDSSAAQSELFLDFALTDAIRVGVSGIRSDRSRGSENDAVTRMGLSAAYALDQGTFVQGGVADAPDSSVVFGLSVGFRF